MLIDDDAIIEILFKTGNFNDIKGAFHIGAHDCEELPFYNQLGISDQNAMIRIKCYQTIR